jgi:hypothetical protein
MADRFSSAGSTSLYQRRCPGARVRPADPSEWVEWETEEHFFAAADAFGAATMLKLNAVAAASGLPDLEEPPRG